MGVIPDRLVDLELRAKDFFERVADRAVTLFMVALFLSLAGLVLCLVVGAIIAAL